MMIVFADGTVSKSQAQSVQVPLDETSAIHIYVERDENCSLRIESHSDARGSVVVHQGDKFITFPGGEAPSDLEIVRGKLLLDLETWGRYITWQTGVSQRLADKIAELETRVKDLEKPTAPESAAGPAA